MRLRWNFHRLMLGQSMSFYQDEFAGRVATKVMQTALAVRDTWMIVADILVFVVIYFVTMVAVVGGFDAWLLLPFLGWLVLYVAALWYFVPRLGKVAQGAGRRALADDRPHHRRLHQHRHRQAVLARAARGRLRARRDAGVHGHRARADAAGDAASRSSTTSLSMGLIAGTAGVTLWLWTRGQVGVGAVAAATAMALRLNGISHWVMWEMADAVRAHRHGAGRHQHAVAAAHRGRPARRASRCAVTRGEIRFERVSFAYGGRRQACIDDLIAAIRPGEKIGLVGRSGAGKSTIVNLLLRFYDVRAAAAS